MENEKQIDCNSAEIGSFPYDKREQQIARYLPNILKAIVIITFLWTFLWIKMKFWYMVHTNFFIILSMFLANSKLAKKQIETGLHILLLSAVMYIFISASLVSGIEGGIPGKIHYWFFALIIVSHFAFINNFYVRLFYTVMLTALIIAFEYALIPFKPIYILDEKMEITTQIVTIVSVVVVIGLFLHLIVKAYNFAEAMLRDQHEKVEKAYSLLSKYVPSQLTDTISTGQVESMSTHQRKKLTIFFSDIEDFTIMTDGMEPEDMANMLNDYLSEMDKIVDKHKGTLAQVVGDALFVFFGAPGSTNDKDHALRCTYMAIDMQRKIKELQKKWFKIGIDEIVRVRCGINTGMATVGSFGSSTRKLYNAHGMQVNLAARLEQACTPGSILISHSTWGLINNEISTISKGSINAKRYHKPVRVYEIDLDRNNFSV